MKNLVIEANEHQYTPGIYCNADQNLFELSGKSFPENASAFYAPVFEWLLEYFEQLGDDDEVVVNIELGYYNSSSNRKIADFLYFLNQKAFDDAVPVDVNWFYDDDNINIREDGEDFKADYPAILFKLVEKQIEQKE